FNLQPKFTQRLQNLVSDYLFVFTYIYPHFRIILQIRSAFCKKKLCHLDQNWQSYVEIFI
ncbi:hypothetical protein K443DRAFT_100515, partial [Laccaria amethystina LaAM-08-1]